MKMNKLSLIIIAMAVIFACTKQKGYRIDVKLEGATGKILLEKRGTGAWITVDSAEVKNGAAVFTGNISIPDVYYISVEGKPGKAMLFVENAKLTVLGNADSLNLVKVTGSVTHSEFATVNDKIQDIQKEYMGIYKQAQEANAAGDTIRGKELMNKVEETYNQVPKLQEEFVKSNPASFATPYFLSGLQYEKTEEEMESLLKNLDPKLDSVKSVVMIKERLAKLKTVAVGQIAPDFTQNDSNGNPVKFSDVYSKNELTLLDFWASWCGPCRQENPNVVAVYNQFKDKGFTVFGVSLDREKEAWLKAITDDKLTWQHVSDLKFWGNEAAELYAVNSIPSSLIVDKTGKIIAKNKRGDELKSTIEELIGKK
jgi:peroxiredoxin